MGKQTKQSGSHFGGEWTKEKLIIIEDYLKFYVRALSRQKTKLVYIDAFAGSGKTCLSDGSEVDGSAIISLSCDFDEYYFIEIDQERVSSLKNTIQERFPHKLSKIHIIHDNCNERLKSIFSRLSVYQRGVMFLDPYALELDWSVLEQANKTKILDIWYLFPLNALTRNLPKKKTLSQNIKQKLNITLGTTEWESKLYHENPQISMFDDIEYERVDFDELVSFVKDRLSDTFAYVSPKSRILKNSKNSALFILFFMMTNNSPRAISLGSKVVDDIFSKIDKMTKSKR